MANEWRDLALTLPGTLREASTVEEAIRLIDLAIIKLEAQDEALRANRVGVDVFYVEPHPAGVSTATLLEAAGRDIKRRSTLHGLADSALPLCCEAMGLVLSAEMAQSWDRHNSDALRNAQDAQMRLLNGATLAKAAVDAVDLAAALPRGAVILQSAWLVAAEQLQDAAIREVYRARHHVGKMRDSLSLQVSDARSILQLA